MSESIKVGDWVSMWCPRDTCDHRTHIGDVRSIRTTDTGVTLVVFVDETNTTHQAAAHMVQLVERAA